MLRCAYEDMGKVSIPDSWQLVRIVTANVGNLSWGCGGRLRYNYKLCYSEVETRVAVSIADLHPDVVVLQEALHPAQCEGWIETDPSKACYRYQEKRPFEQVRRLLGQDYTIACFYRNRAQITIPAGVECIAVHVKSGSIEGCPLGELCYDVGTMDNPAESCNPEFLIASVGVNLKGLAVTIVNVHPNNHNIICREESIRQIFEVADKCPPLASGRYNLIAGDLNYDPFKSGAWWESVWDRYVGLYGHGKMYYYHSGPAEQVPPYPTLYQFCSRRTVDHVASNFALGTCITLGTAPNTQRLDGGRGMDHRAILCNLWIPHAEQ